MYSTIQDGMGCIAMAFWALAHTALFTQREEVKTMKWNRCIVSFIRKDQALYAKCVNQSSKKCH
jgi:hypothetical protein